MELHDVARITHEPKCPGLIRSGRLDHERLEIPLVCSECGKTVGGLQRPILDQIVRILDKCAQLEGTAGA
jgi:hypothetical protein